MKRNGRNALWKRFVRWPSKAVDGKAHFFDGLGRPSYGMRVCLFVVILSSVASAQVAEQPILSWSELPPLPDELGVAGPFAGVHNDALIVAGGANFPHPVWENDKVWHDAIHVLVREGDRYVWKDGGKLPRSLAYGAAVSTDAGIVCIGGNDAAETFGDVFLLKYDSDSGRVSIVDYPPLPEPCAFAAATMVGNVIYLAGGQTGQLLETATNQFLSLDLTSGGKPRWKRLDPIPGPTRALNITATQRGSVYVISGRRQSGEQVEFLKDVWQYTPNTGAWRKRSDVPRSVMAGTGIGWGQRHVVVLGGADGSLFHRSDELRDRHPGFPKEALAYDTVSDTWTSAGPIPRNHVTTIAVRWGDSIIVPSGEVRPRVRSPKIWKVNPR